MASSQTQPTSNGPGWGSLRRLWASLRSASTLTARREDFPLDVDKSSPIHRLPPELLILIMEYLPAASVIAFRCTGRHFFIKAESEPLQNLYRRAWGSSDAERFFVQCFQDHMSLSCSSKRRYVCWPCKTTHSADWFDKAELSSRPGERKCRTVPICPHGQMSLTQFRSILEHPPETGSICPRNCHPRSHNVVNGLASCTRLNPTLRDGQLWWSMRSRRKDGPWLVSRFNLPLVALLSCLRIPNYQSPLPDLNVSLCGHTTVEVALAGAFENRMYGRIHSKGCYTCLHCPTSVNIYINGQAHVDFICMRWFGTGSSPTERPWLEQASKRLQVAR